MKEITYLFGAGASKNALPVVNDLASDFKTVISKLGQKTRNTSADAPDGHNNLIKELNVLANAAETHASIDTYAKKLYLTDDKSGLKRLKCALSAYFLIKQATKVYDKRYDTFYASILSNSCTFPKNIKVASWNYDSQFEKAFVPFVKMSSEIPKIPDRLRITHKFNMHHPRDSDFSIIKLNGVADFLEKNDMPYVMELPSSLGCHFSKEDLTDEYLTEIVQAYNKAILGKCHSAISFAWESQELILERGTNFIDETIEILKGTEILIVIGYSFPFFNRDIDRMIIRGMDKLEKVYIQDKLPDGVIERFQAIRDDFEDGGQIIPRTATDQFYLPNEL